MHRTMISGSQGDKLKLDLPLCNLFNHTRGIRRQQRLCKTPFSTSQKVLFARGLLSVRTSLSNPFAKSVYETGASPVTTKGLVSFVVQYPEATKSGIT